MSSSLRIVRPGIACTIQDLGRAGMGSIGVPMSGAADRGAAARANRIVGNGAAAALLEITLGRLTIVAQGPVLLAVTGARVRISVTGADGATRAAAMDGPVPLGDGDTLTLGSPAAGLRSYLAVCGGIDVPPQLASRSTDVLSGLGPPPVAAGIVLPVGDQHPGLPHPAAPPASAGDPTGDPYSGRAVLTALPGPRLDWFVDGAFDLLLGAAWQVTSASNRVGLRLAGPVVPRIGNSESGSQLSAELPSEGLVPGAVQVQPSGEPVLFLADHPVTGGYPVIAVVTSADVQLAAQLRPGDRLRFRRQGAGPVHPAGPARSAARAAAQAAAPGAAPGSTQDAGPAHPAG